MSILKSDFTTTFTSVTAIATALMVTSPAHAQETVSDIRSETVEVAEGETLEVTAEGSIEPSGSRENGVEAQDSTTITNAGSIASLGEQSSAVVVGDNAVVTNSGRIVAANLAAADPFAGASILRTDEAAVLAEDGLTLTNEAGATLIAEASNGFTDGAVVRAGDEATLVNAGSIETQSDGVEAISVGDDLNLTNSGSITSAEERAIEAGDGAIIVNSGTIQSADRAINLGDGATIINEMGGLINTTGDADTIQSGDNLTVINNGTISNEGEDQKIIDAGDGLTVTNNGTITSDWKGVEGEADFTLTNNEGALIFSTNDEAVEADGPGLVVINNGEIISPKDDAVDGGADVTITNTGLIRGGENDALELDSGSITNSGIIESLSSDPDGDFSDAGLTNRELDAGIDFDGVDDPDDLEGPDFDTVTNLEGGIIRGDIGINASSGNFVSDGEGGSEAGSPANVRDQVIVNYGEITGNLENPATGRTDAVLLSFGDDTFRQMQTGVTNGTVDGEDGNDTLIFGNDGMMSVTRDLANVFDPAQYTGFETIGFLDQNGGGISLIGDTDETLNILRGSITIEGTVTETVEVLGEATLTVAEGASVDVADDDGINVDVDGVTIVNNGTIGSADDETIEAGSVNDLTVINNGLIIARDGGDKAIESEQNLTVINTGRIESVLDEAVEAEDAGLFLDNSGEIIAPFDDAVDGDADVTIINSGLIQGGENDGLELDSGVITNSGIIESLSSDPDGDFSDAGLTNRELDAGIDFDGVDDPDTLAGPETDLVTNLEGGIIRGDIGINASSGNFVSDGEGGSEAGSPANVREQVIVNFGEITANLVNPVSGRMDAVLLSFGDDEFQQWTGAVVNGWVDLEAGDDTFILEGTSSSVTGGVSGGIGNDTAILAGDLDSDNIVDFETIQLGSTLGGTLNDLDITGNRSITGDVVHVGVVNIDLGVDTLTTTGSITLEETGVLNIATPLDAALVGQSVLVFEDTTGFTNNGATVNIIDDDLLIDYTPVVGSLRVQVGAANVLANNVDPNLAAFGGAVAGGLAAGTLSSGAFAALNSLPDETSYARALSDALPSLSGGAGREIFETGNLASAALDQHLMAGGSGVWGQIAVRGASQDAQSTSVDGYESDQIVFTLGGDFEVSNGIKVGLIASYADIDVDDETNTRLRTSTLEIDSVKLGAYVASGFMERGFFNAELSYLTGEIDASRSGLLGPVSSNYDFDGIAGRFTLGYDVLPDENVWVTPSVGLNFAQVRFDDALETGGFAFQVEREDADFLEARFGVEAGAKMSEGVSGFIRGTVIEDIADDPEAVTLGSTQLPAFTVAPPVREDGRFEIAAGAMIDVNENVSINVGYLGDFNEGYKAHSGRASVRIAF